MSVKRGHTVAGKPVSVNEVFGADSDEEDVPQQKQKPASSAVLDPEEKDVADKLAEFVAKNGREYEDLTRQKNPGNTPFRFLWNKSSPVYQYYDAKVRGIGRDLRKSPAAPAADPPSSRGPDACEPRARDPAGHHGAGASSSNSSRKRNRWDDKPPLPAGPSASSHVDRPAYPHPPAAPPARPAAAGPQGPPPAPGPAPGPGSGTDFASALAAAKAAAAQAAAAAAAGGRQSGAGAGGSGTLTAMEQYMRRLASAGRSSGEEEEDEEEAERRKNAQPFLKETAFDRRKVVAVYKDTGERGHHMQDFIPPEELAKFMAECGDSSAKAQLQQLQHKNAIGADNIGHKLLQKMGWKEGQGVGADGRGMTAPVAANVGGPKQDNLGLGAQAHGAVESGDDMFEQYRKRMMLGYKHRPNPLGNPRKSYY